MKLIELDSNTVIVVHPNDPDVKVELSEPTFDEKWIHANAALKERDDLEAGLRRMAAFLPKYITRLSGVTDKEGKPITLEAPFGAREFNAISKSGFDVEIERDVEVRDAEGKLTGRYEKKVVREPFPVYLMGRLMSEDLFSVPLASGQTPSTSISSGD